MKVRPRFEIVDCTVQGPTTPTTLPAPALKSIDVVRARLEALTIEQGTKEGMAFDVTGDDDGLYSNHVRLQRYAANSLSLPTDFKRNQVKYVLTTKYPKNFNVPAYSFSRPNPPGWYEHIYLGLSEELEPQAFTVQIGPATFNLAETPLQVRNVFSFMRQYSDVYDQAFELLAKGDFVPHPWGTTSHLSKSGNWR